MSQSTNERIKPYIKLLRKAITSPQQPQFAFCHTLIKLCDPNKFRTIIFGKHEMPADVQLPSSLQELLNHEIFTRQAHNIILQSYRHGQKVLQNVKTNGEKHGDRMTSETEKEVWPGIFCESFAVIIKDALQAAMKARLKIESRLHHTQVNDSQESIHPHIIQLQKMELEQLYGCSETQNINFHYNVPVRHFLGPNLSYATMRHLEYLAQGVPSIHQPCVEITKIDWRNNTAVLSDCAKGSLPTPIDICLGHIKSLSNDMNSFVSSKGWFDKKLCSPSASDIHILKLQFNATGNEESHNFVQLQPTIEDIFLRANTLNAAFSITGVYVITRSNQVSLRWTDNHKQKREEKLSTDTMYLFQPAQYQLELGTRENIDQNCIYVIVVPFPTILQGAR